MAPDGAATAAPGEVVPMLITCWSPKGGSGVTVVTAALALLACGPDGGPPGAVVALDAAGRGRGDLAGALGITAGPTAGPTAAGPTGPGGGPGGGPGTGVEVGSVGPLVVRTWPERAPLGPLLAAGELVVADVGPGLGSDADLISAAAHCLAVIRPCYLGVRRLVASEGRVDGIVVVEEPDRALGVDDIEHVTGRPVVARVRWDASVARAVDAGLLASRLPRALRALQGVLTCR